MIACSKVVALLEDKKRQTLFPRWERMFFPCKLSKIPPSFPPNYKISQQGASYLPGFFPGLSIFLSFTNENKNPHIKFLLKYKSNRVKDVNISDPFTPLQNQAFINLLHALLYSRALFSAVSIISSQLNLQRKLESPKHI